MHSHWYVLFSVLEGDMDGTSILHACQAQRYCDVTVVFLSVAVSRRPSTRRKIRPLVMGG
eukprot:scaffold32511_cov72-Skeletonema_dohrnii-CCMP3373.AAC.1